MYRYNSLAAKFYRLSYDTEQMPTKGCVYFWRVIIALIFSVVFLPLVLFSYLLFGYVLHSTDDDNDTVFSKTAIGFMFALMLCVVWMVIGLLLYPFFYSHIFFFPNDKDTPIFSSMIYGVIMLFLIPSLTRGFRRRAGSKLIIVEAVKAAYHKLCPIIEWDYNSKKNKKKVFLEE